jgi:hypothetical protein
MVWPSVNVVAPSTPGTCWVGWKMTDAAGHYLMPNYRPIYFLVRVVATPTNPDQERAIDRYPSLLLVGRLG